MAGRLQLDLPVTHTPRQLSTLSLNLSFEYIQSLGWEISNLRNEEKVSFTETIIEPQNIEHPDTLVMYPFPIFGTIQNTGDRLQATANEFGAPIVASDLYLQNKKTIFDMAARDANQPAGDVYETMSQRRADFYTNIADKLGATTRIGMGDSLAVSAIQGMQLNSGYETFDALLLRDGWNLDEETTVIRGILRYGRYQVRDAIHQRRDHVKFDIPETPYKKIPAEESETGGLAKLQNVADIMRGPHNMDNALRLARFTDVVMNVVVLKDGLSSSSSSKQRDFTKELRDARAERYPYKSVIGLQAKQYPGWHSDLLDPQRGADDLRRTLDLIAKK